jgi:hypothetical protein
MAGSCWEAAADMSTAQVNNGHPPVAPWTGYMLLKLVVAELEAAS